MSAKRLITHDGITDSLTGWSRRTGVHVTTLHARLRLGWSVDRVLMTPKKHARPQQRRRHTWNGETRYLSEWARSTGIPIRILSERLLHGWSVERTLSTPVTPQTPHTGLTRRYKLEYQSWRGANSRCYCPTAIGYARYGGRGITVCDEWRKSFETFLHDVGPRPTPEHSLERVENDLPYTKSNCKWALPIEQNNNQRTNRRLTLNGITQTLAQWARSVGMSPITLGDRLDIQHLPLAEALSRPLDRTRQKKIA